MTQNNSRANDRRSPRGKKPAANRRPNAASLSLDGAKNKRELAETFSASGADALLVGDLDDALDCYRRAVRLDPENATARAGLARTYLADERYELAFDEADRAVVGLLPRGEPALLARPPGRRLLGRRTFHHRPGARGRPQVAR